MKSGVLNGCKTACVPGRGGAVGAGCQAPQASFAGGIAAGRSTGTLPVVVANCDHLQKLKFSGVAQGDVWPGARAFVSGSGGGLRRPEWIASTPSTLAEPPRP